MSVDVIPDLKRRITRRGAAEAAGGPSGTDERGGRVGFGAMRFARLTSDELADRAGKAAARTPPAKRHQTNHCLMALKYQTGAKQLSRTGGILAGTVHHQKEQRKWQPPPTSR